MYRDEIIMKSKEKQVNKKSTIQNRSLSSGSEYDKQSQVHNDQNFNRGQNVGGQVTGSQPARSGSAERSPETVRPSDSMSMKQRGNADQNRGIRRALGFQEILQTDFRTGIPTGSSSAPVAKEEIQKKLYPGYRSFAAMRNTATINDIFFLNPMLGWAVGDRGTIWLTNDGGNHWYLNDLPFDENLYSVHFMNEQVGLAVGGSVLPGGKNGRALLLRSEDGGRTWNSVSHCSFPILRKVRFIAPNRVWVSGDSSELHPGGIFVSQDAGKTWTPDRGTRNAGWISLVWDPVNRFGVGIGSDGSFQTLSGADRKTKELPIGPRRLRDLVCSGGSDPLRMSGESGLLLQSIDAGVNWTSLSGNLPADLADCFDFNTIEAKGQCIWTAGSPGSIVFFSSDGGAHWNSAFTGVQAPLKKIFFTDEQNGWAAGDFGTIIVTRNGGRTWTVQREGGRRLSMLALWCDNTAIPWEFFVQFAGEEGYLCRLELLCRDLQKEKSNDEIPRLLRLQDAMIETGADGLSENGIFRIESRDFFRSAEKIFERFNRENDNKGLEKFRERLVRQIRIWRPNLLVIEEGSPNSFQAFLERELPLAIQSAADPLAWPIHLSGCRLIPWKVDRVEKMKRFRQNDQRLDGQTASGNSLDQHFKGICLDSGYFCSSLGRSTGEIARKARSFLDSDNPTIPEKIRFDLLYDRLNTASNFDRSGNSNSDNGSISVSVNNNTLTTRSIPVSNNATVNGLGKTEPAGFFTGLDISAGGEARRLPLEINPVARQELQERSGQRRRLLGIVESFSGKNNRSGEILISQINDMIRGLDSDLAVEYLLKVGKELYQQGNWIGAEEVYSKIALDYPMTPLSREACLWLIAYYSGSEPFWMAQDKNRFIKTEAALGSVNGQNAGLQSANSLSRLALDTSVMNPGLKNAGELGKMIRDLLPELYMTPEVRFPLAMIQRRQGFVNDAMKFYLNRSLVSKDDLWGIRAKAEYWLAVPNSSELPPEEQFCPLPSIPCRSIVNKPYLDGLLEPEIWSSAQQTSLSQKRVLPESERDNSKTRKEIVWKEENKKLSQDFGTHISFLYDNEYLYIGIEAQKVPGLAYSEDKRPRERDFDLDPFDRIEIQFDVDRDYTTCWKFVFDCRGWAQESAWENSHWDPRLFIAPYQDDKKWSLEIAVPWEELAQKPPLPSDVWAVSLRRIVPQQGIECWNVENSERGENGFGFMTFGMNGFK